MRVDRVTYQKVFPIALYINHKVGLEIQLDEGETVEQALDYAKETAEQWHKAQYPGEPFVPVYEEPPAIDLRDEAKIISIENASTIEELATLKKDLPTHLMKAYMDKLKQLTT